MEGVENQPSLPNVLFREIHKNAYLKKHSNDKRSAFQRRPEKVWTVFCVHDDTEAFLELYTDQKAALAHKPDFFVSLRNALHISPSICGQAEEFEFAVTLPTQVLRLSAPSWDSMMEWVDTLRNKLRELRVLAPKENIYTKMPEPKHVLLPTRDPTSPLPLPPVGPAGLLPGVESPARSAVLSTSPPAQELVVNLMNRITGVNIRDTGTHVNNTDPTLVDIRTRAAACSNEVVELIEPSSVGISDSAISAVDNLSVLSNSVGRDTVTFSTSSQRMESRNSRREKNPSLSIACGSSLVVVSDSSDKGFNLATSSDSTNTPTSPDVVNGRKLMRASSVPSTSNVTVIEVPPPSPHYEHLFLPELEVASEEVRVKLERVTSSGLIPRVPNKHSRNSESRKASSPSRARERCIASSSHEEQVSHIRVNGSSPLVKTKEPLHSSIVSVKGREPALPPKESLKPSGTGSSFSSSVHVTGHGSSSIKSTQMTFASPSISREPVEVPPIPAAFQPPPAGLEVRDIPLIGGHQRRRRRSSSSDAGPNMRGMSGADLIRVAPAEAPESTGDAPCRTLRESQVCQLKREMGHPGGVRLPLRRKDCVGTIALVDVSNAVWVAGWKQREHPMLYNALHIGDQVISAGDIMVRSAVEAQKVLRSCAGPTIELVVRRLPMGVVFALQRPRNGVDVGLIPDHNSPAEVNVIPGGAADRAGIHPRTATMDGLSLTTWTLTEVNGRPLNLFCKSADVVTRLNSVGKELSVLLQPSDFIKLLRKQLKTVKGYKEYLLQ